MNAKIVFCMKNEVHDELFAVIRLCIVSIANLHLAKRIGGATGVGEHVDGISAEASIAKKHEHEAQRERKLRRVSFLHGQ